MCGKNIAQPNKNAKLGLLSFRPNTATCFAREMVTVKARACPDAHTVKDALQLHKEITDKLVAMPPGKKEHGDAKPVESLNLKSHEASLPSSPVSSSSDFFSEDEQTLCLETSASTKRSSSPALAALPSLSKSDACKEEPCNDYYFRYIGEPTKGGLNLSKTLHLNDRCTRIKKRSKEGTTTISGNDFATELLRRKEVYSKTRGVLAWRHLCKDCVLLEGDTLARCALVALLGEAPETYRLEDEQ